MHTKKMLQYYSSGEMYTDVKRLKFELVLLEEIWSLNTYSHLLQGGNRTQINNRTWRFSAANNEDSNWRSFQASSILHPLSQPTSPDYSWRYRPISSSWHMKPLSYQNSICIAGLVYLSRYTEEYSNKKLHHFLKMKNSLKSTVLWYEAPYNLVAVY
jgi:hypothetical protein